MNFLAKIISYIFHPFLMPAIGVFIILNTKNYISAILSGLEIYLYGIVFTFTLLLPIIFALILLKLNLISSLQMTSRIERQYPLIMTTIFYMFNYYMIVKFQLPQLINQFFLSLTICVVLALLINFKWKISTHMIGIGGIVGLLFALSERLSIDVGFWIICAILISGFIGFARLKLNTHTSSQIYTGFLIGAACVSIIMIFF